MPLIVSTLKKYINDAILLISLVAFLILLWGCKYIDPCVQQEVLRVVSPDKVVDFVVLEKDCGATTSVSTLIYIVPTKMSIDDFSPVFKADHIKKLEVEWFAPKNLVISYEKARIFNFTNFWHSRYVDNFKYKVAIREVTQWSLTNPTR